MTTASPGLPPVSPTVAAAALDLLPARLRKRVDGAMGKVSGWPVETTPDGARIVVDEDTSVTLKVTAGIVARADDAVCSCLLAPACLHRAAVLSSAPLAQEQADPAEEVDEPARTEAPPPPKGVPGAAATARAAESAAGPPAHPAIQDSACEGPTLPGKGATSARHRTGSTTGPRPCDENSEDAASPVLTHPQLTALASLRTAATAVLVSGVSGAGAVQRAELLHAAHSGRLAGLHLPAAAAVRIARRLDEARSDAPSFRLPELSAELAGLLGLIQGPADAVTPARRAYQPAGPLRLYGLFTEPIVTASGYAGAIAYGLAPDGTLLTISDVAPGDPQRAIQAAQAPVPGGCALSLREWGNGGSVILTGPTVSADGRVGGGSRVRSVRAAGATWHQPPLDALWQGPPADQLARALDWLEHPADIRPAGGDLLFLTGTVTQEGLRITGGPQIQLIAPDERSELAYADNIRLLLSRTGLELRLIARVVPDRPGSIQALAASWTGHDGERFRADLGLRRLNRSHIPAPKPPDGRGVVGRPAPGEDRSDTSVGRPGGSPEPEGHQGRVTIAESDPLPASEQPLGPPLTTGPASGTTPKPPPPPASAPGLEEPPVGSTPCVPPVGRPGSLSSAPPALPIELDLLRRTVDRAVAGGRGVTAASADGELPRRLESVGLATGALCARALLGAAAERRHDALGRLLPADPDGFATAWLAAATYVSAAVRSLLPAAWSTDAHPTAADPPGPGGR
ncbi:hypothetical protein [Streptomyces albipurpureus]|uniref:SWIM-type domain-containing protein n=1 Tax=Streptomyces albipurpureus TaxID=2897419 RepID=A0ABT0UIT4_9ACTN|nr:hypothetical protein [Streptomyces sp. CWNU-1]MCM2388542.1 hypothetical protein [Streptomyces sp. CWNU-1]